MFTRRWVYSSPVVCIGEFRVRFAWSIRYLSVQLDAMWDFGPHCREVAAKAAAVSAAVSRLLPNTGGSTAAKSRLLATVVYVMLLYTSVVWAHTAMSATRNRVVLGRPVSSVAFRAIRAYRTISTEGRNVLVGTHPRQRRNDRKGKSVTIATR